jgi:hypothetical protein
MTGGNTLAQLTKAGGLLLSLSFGKVAWEKQFFLSCF